MIEKVFVGDLNFSAEIVSKEKLPKKLILHDVTLREPEEGPDIVLSLEDKLTIARKLDEIGIPQIQAGFAIKDKAVTAALKCENLRCEISVLAGAVGSPRIRDALNTAVDSGADSVILIHRGSDQCLKYLGVTREEMLLRVVNDIEFAKERGIAIRFDVTDATRSNLDFLKNVLETAVKAGAEVIGLSDTLGVGKPSVIRFMVEQIKKTVNTPLGIHCHNDFGMAVACTLAGVEGGAELVDVCVNGLGPRSGNAPLATVVVALESLYGIDLGIKTEKLKELSELMAQLTKVRIPAIEPVVGRNLFAKMTDAQVVAMKKGAHFMTEPFEPDWVGNKRWIDIGINTGPEGMKAKSEELSIHLPEKMIPQILRSILKEAAEKRTSLTDEEFRSIVASAE